MTDAVFSAAALAASDVAEALRRRTGTVCAGGENTFGDTQLVLDLEADRLIRKRLRECACVYACASEEFPDLEILNPEGTVVVSFDPIDGSSILDCNWTTGSIFSVWPKSVCSGGNWQPVTGRAQLAAGMTVFGNQTSLIWADLVNSKLISKSIESGVIKYDPFEKSTKSTIFSPGNLKSAADLPKYRELINLWIERRLTLRYSGGLVPDIFHLLTKSNGIFCSPISEKAPAKLRLLFEVAPIAAIVEAAGGATAVVPGNRKSALDVVIHSPSDKCSLIAGSPKLVAEALSFL